MATANSTARSKSKKFELLHFDPFISNEEIERLEDAANDSARGLQRRLCLVACARSSDDMKKLLIAEPDAFLEMFEMINSFLAHTKGLSEIAEQAFARMAAVGEKEAAQTALADDTALIGDTARRLPRGAR